MEPPDFDRQDHLGRTDLFLLPLVGAVLTCCGWMAQLIAPFVLLFGARRPVEDPGGDR